MLVCFVAARKIKFASVKFCVAMKLQAPFSPISVLVIAALVVCAPIALGWRSFKVIFTSFPYEYNAQVLDAKLEIRNNTEYTYLAISLQVHEDLDDLNLKYVIELELDKGKYAKLLNHSMNFCKFLKQHSMAPVLSNIYEDLLKRSNFIERCPIKKGTYKVQEYHVDEEMLPNYVPETSFFVDIKLSKSNGELLFDGKLHGKFDKTTGFNNLKMFSLGL